MTVLALLLIGIALLLAFVPQWSRPELYFGVTVGTDFALMPAGRRIMRRYWLELALHTLGALGVLALLGGRPWTIAVALGWLIAGTTWAVARANRATRAWRRAPAGEPAAAVETLPEPAPQAGLPGGWAVALGPLAFLAAMAVYAAFNWERLPEQIPVHWGLRGADRWVARTPAQVYGFLGALASFCAVFLAVAWAIARGTRRIAGRGARVQRQAAFRRVTLWLMVGLPYLVAIPASVMAFWPGIPAVWLWPAAIVAVSVAALVALIRLQRGTPATADAPAVESGSVDGTPDDAWKWGQFYYNPDDPELIVERRFGVGYTFNFANPWSWILMAILLVPVVLTIVLV
jgi:uncharacterized membrane protein